LSVDDIGKRRGRGVTLEGACNCLSLAVEELQDDLLIAGLLAYRNHLLFITANIALSHKVRIYKEYHSVCPLFGIGLGLSHPLSRQRVCPSPPNKGGRGGTIACGWGVREVPIPSDEWRKSLALCLLCECSPLKAQTTTVV